MKREFTQSFVTCSEPSRRQRRMSPGLENISPFEDLGGGARVVVLPIRDKGSSRSLDYALYIGPGDDKQRGKGPRSEGYSRLRRGH